MTSRSRDRLAFYRLVAGIPVLETFHAKVNAVVLAATLLPAFLLVLAIVLGAGRMSVLGLIALVVVFAFVAATATIWGLSRLLAPLDLAADSLEDLALGRPLARLDLPGSDAAAQTLRGFQALVARNEALVSAAKTSGEHDELTGLWGRRAGRERAQALIDRDTHRGRAVRAIVADVNDFTAFNAQQGAGHGDALLKTIGSRLARVAGDDGIAIRWHGDAFLLVQAGTPDEWPDAGERLGRPIVVKGSEAPLTLALGVAQAAERVTIDALAADAEAALAIARESQ